MKLKTLLLLLLVALSGCRAGETRTPENPGGMPYGKWGFAFFTPHALPAVVTFALIIDTGEIVSTYRMLDSTPADPNSVGSWYLRRSLFPYFNKAWNPPALMLICWDSIIDKKAYETRIVFPPSLPNTMLTPLGKDRYGETVWYKTLLFGLAPEGKVRIWLQSSDERENVPLEPKRITTLSGDNMDGCKGITRHPNGYVYYGDTPEFIKGKTYPYGNW
jgi:hypothetical protein